MQLLLELAPVVAFFVAYFAAGIYVATGVLMAAMALVLLVDYVRARSIPTLHAVSAVLVFAFGAATLVLHNNRFIQLKTTVLFWLLGLALLASMWIGRQPLMQRLLGAALEGQLRVPDAAWRRLNLVSALFYLLLGTANLLVALNTSEANWVKFKIIAIVTATVVFPAALVAWLFRQSSEAPSPQA